MVFLRSVNLDLQKDVKRGWPYDIPVVQSTDTFDFSSPVTFLVGENGSGKSTILEAIAAGLNMIAVGSEDVARDETLGPARRLSEIFRFVFSQRTRRGFFLRAEDFFGYAKKLARVDRELNEMSEEYEKNYSGYGLQLAKGSVEGQRAAMKRRYGEQGLDARSHGESFLTLFQSRLVPKGLYLLDEPEAPLSPIRQIALLGMIKDLVEQDSQFIIATHSPILMAFPGATILSFDEQPVASVPYEELEHVTLTRAFLNNPEVYLRRL